MHQQQAKAILVEFMGNPILLLDMEALNQPVQALQDRLMVRPEELHMVNQELQVNYLEAELLMVKQEFHMDNQVRVSLDLLKARVALVKGQFQV